MRGEELERFQWMSSVIIKALWRVEPVLPQTLNIASFMIISAFVI